MTRSRFDLHPLKPHRLAPTAPPSRFQARVTKSWEAQQAHERHLRYFALALVACGCCAGALLMAAGTIEHLLHGLNVVQAAVSP
jgi:hypothetical protein